MKKLLILLFVSLVVFSACSINVDFGDEDDGENSNESVMDEGVGSEEEALAEQGSDESKDEVEKRESDKKIQEDAEDEKNGDDDSKTEKISNESDDKIETSDLIERGEGELSDIQIIKKYYKLIEDGELEEAYAMKYNPSMTYATYVGWYKNTNDTYAYDFEELSKHKYRFTVELDEENVVEETYVVVTEVVDGKIKNISSTKTWDNYSPEAYTKKINGKTNLYVIDGGVEKWVVETDDSAKEPVDRMALEDYRFLMGGKYLVYELSGYEWKVIGVFDVESGKKVHEIFGGGADYGFTSDGKYFFQCAGDGMHGGFMDIYSVPNFNLYKNLKASDSGALLHTCYGYNSVDAVYNYAVSFDGFQNPQPRRYHFDTGLLE